MSMARLFIIGAALSFAAAPVGAQNATDANTTDVAAENNTAPAANVGAPAPEAAVPTDANAMEPIDSNTGEIDTSNIEPAPAPTDSGSKTFPWGLLGLLGLLGLIPRLRRGG